MPFRKTAVVLTLLLAFVPPRPKAVYLQEFAVNSLEADGLWCPMAHCNRNDDSFQDLPPLLNVGPVQKITDPLVSPRGGIFLGCFTGEVLAVCAYNSPGHPALVAYHYEDGSIKWMSPLEDLPGQRHRKPAGVLIAKITIGGNPSERFVFAANHAEFVAYTIDGSRIWKRATQDINPEGFGWPVSLSFTDAKELVTVTTEGWVVKLNPIDGSTIDAYRMDTNVIW